MSEESELSHSSTVDLKIVDQEHIDEEKQNRKQNYKK